MVYVHVPFCGSFCTYCDFYSELACTKGPDVRNTSAFDEYTCALCAETLRRSAEIKKTLHTNTLYIGGGTPSVLPLDHMERIVSAVKSAAETPFDEFTVEVNPEDIVAGGEDYVGNLLSLGVNRISMGVQSLDDGILRWMGRRHNAARAIEAFSMLRKAGCRNISLDLIFGISHLSDKMLEDSLLRLLALGPEHISAYQLSVEDGSALHEMVSRGIYTEASDEQCRRQYSLICDTLRKAGYVHYEISNWALPGREAVHNSAYWTRQPYVGLGPGAHSLSFNGDEQRRSWNSEKTVGWTSEYEILSPDEILEEEVMLGMRTLHGWCGRVLTEEEWFISDDIISDVIAGIATP